MVGAKQTKAGLAIRYTLATLILLVMIFPFIYMILQSFAPWDQVDRVLIPTKLTLRSWQWLFGNQVTSGDAPWLQAFFNTVFVSTISTVLQILFAVMVSYALAKVPFIGKVQMNNFILFQMFFPGIILLVPQFLMVTKVGLIDTYVGMILPGLMNLWAVFMFTNFFKAIPDTLIEAAKLDGAKEKDVLFRIVLPMSKSITTVIFLFLFTARWTDLLWDMLMTKSNGTLTLNVLLSQMFGPYESYPGPMYAGSVLLTLPLIIIFLLCSNRFKEGMDFALK